MAAKTRRDASEFVPDSIELSRLREASRSCRGCDLYQDATQTVFGEGPRQADVLVLGEQPGDREDREGEPFVGPAGKLLDRALVEAGIDRERVYVTNAVKHFKFTRSERGKQRIHKKPARGEIVACRPWLLAELKAVQPKLVVLLGATAASSLMGPSFRVTEHRGELIEAPEEFGGCPERVLPTVHPSSVLRAPDRDEAYAALVKDLKEVPRGL
ncbi:DNA polymerase [Amycolatopsis bartoniae]|uniref:Type-4 uracil-DNA glycosylase n=1 Tax=Amycolatopsis bartoniae TaxID=941986 RepID=A0A8H9M8E3_9PSEU|nr:UdgX family uracil-DNA binding protein [Amycolatopsis bartoniae]MBB2937583.1 DNA polymerase [Amycolatopsis bartoniae]TVT05907.1 UdgX family uracil-DNA binding protein [Amycolatopsis bartoniae]GHF82353.1 uracil-DNA glycosylase [Amycolatopsis bartoniae]